MGVGRLNRVQIAADIVLDGRLALFHKRDRWLAVADLHFGYELSQRAAGNLFPLWGMQTIEDRLLELLHEYEPAHLLLLGDLVHNRAGGDELRRLVEKLGELTEVILIAGNHDRHLRNLDLVSSWRSNGFHFHHGHCAAEGEQQIQVIGHHHPAAVVRDGAGLRLKLPAFVQEQDCWIMPAFSPWAAGTEWLTGEETTVWLCSPTRVLRLEGNETGKT